MDETKPGESVEELMSVCAGREDELIQNLEKMKSKNEMTSSHLGTACRSSWAI